MLALRFMLIGTNPTERIKPFETRHRCEVAGKMRRLYLLVRYRSGTYGLGYSATNFIVGENFLSCVPDTNS